jgi:hypothetical protein
LRALWLPAVSAALGLAVVIGLGWRSDFGILGAWRTVGFSTIQVGFALAPLLVGLRLSIPAGGGSLAMALAAAAGALLAHLLVSGLTLDASALSPPAGYESTSGLTCLSAIALTSVVPLAGAIVLLRRGVVTRWLLSLLVIGLASGLAGEAVWRLHCPFSVWSHVLPFHTGALLVSLLAATGVARQVRRP